MLLFASPQLLGAGALTAAAAATPAQRNRRILTEGRGGYAGLGGGPGARKGSDDGWGRSSFGSGGSSGGARRPATPYGSSGYNERAPNIPFATRPPGGFSTPNRRDVPEPEDESQDAPAFRPGERVKHARFGSGTIAEITGSGRDTKVRIDFDDEEIGRKTLVLAQAKLEKGWD